MLLRDFNEKIRQAQKEKEEYKVYLSTLQQELDAQFSQ